MNPTSQKFHVYKSSAGSGKTTTLSIEYLKLALGNKQAFKHILALTFTNKAAQEMKDRILKYLGEIIDWNEKKPDLDKKDPPFFLENLLANHPRYSAIKAKSSTAEVYRILKQDAEELYKNLLHHYSEYAVTTIDSFTNRIIRTFSHDLGLSFNYQVELDTRQLLKDVVNELVSRIGVQQDEITQVLLRYSRQKIDEEHSRKINSDLENQAKSLLNDVEEQYLKPLREMKLLEVLEIQKTIIGEIKRFENTLKAFGQEFLNLCKQKGIMEYMFSRGKTSIYPYFNRFVLGDYSRIEPTPTVIKMVEDEAWTTKKAAQADKDLLASVSLEMGSIFERTQDFIKNKESDYILMIEIKKSIFPFMVLMELEKILNETKAENQLVHISDFNKIISDEIAGESAPYIYERIGTKYEHYLLDEFQDTSVLQWNNLLPLVENSLAENHYNLIVGDAKQSIYRWRGGDMEQFARLPYLSYEEGDDLGLQRENLLRNSYLGIYLDTNYRSGKNIVEFNNQLFDYIYSNHYLPESQKSIYADFEQKVKKEEKISSIDIMMMSPENEKNKADYTALYLLKTAEIIKQSKENGYDYRDMAVLARSNKILSELASFLIAQNINVVSSESLFVASSPTVQFILSLLRYIEYPRESVFQVEIIKYLLENNKIPDNNISHLSLFLEGLDHDNQLQDLWLLMNIKLDGQKLMTMEAYDLIEVLIRKIGLDKTDPLVHFFLEASFVFSQDKHQGVGAFLEWWEINNEDYKLDVPDDFDAVNLLSFHKAKGLEFPIVVNWFSQGQMIKSKRLSSTVWIDPKLDVVPKLISFPFSVSKLKNTKHHEIYEKEMELERLDLLNILYVANTRPTEKLFVLVDEYNPPAKPSDSNDLRFDKLMQDFVVSYKMEQKTEHWYRMGPDVKKVIAEDQQAEDGKVKELNYELRTFPTDNWRNDVKLFLDPQEANHWSEAVEWGLKVHAALADISNIDDLMIQKKLWEMKYDMDADERQLMEEIVRQIFSHTLLKPFYEKGIEKYNEIEMFEYVEGAVKIRRPDRMVFFEERLIIIDYKTGMPSQKNYKQVKEYKNLAGAITQHETEAYLVYLHDEIVVEKVV